MINDKILSSLGDMIVDMIVEIMEALDSKSYFGSSLLSWTLTILGLFSLFFIVGLPELFK